jgi:serine/threonine-protein kinase
MQDLSGTTIGQYKLIERIGKGGMAAVYRAQQPSVAREVAIKIISPDLADNNEFATRFEREARIIAGLQHPNILAVHDFGRQGNLTYLVMRLVTGGSLEQEMKAGPMGPDRVIAVTQQIASALDYSHARGIAHRDLKPSNVLLDEMGNCFLTDFGIAKMVRGGAVSQGLTAPGVVMGTPTYMAPEQWRSDPVDGRADIYALGILIYQMLLGRAPFVAETPHGLMYQHLDLEPPSPRDLRPDLPYALEPVLRQALAKNPDQRQASAGALAADLTQALMYSNTQPAFRGDVPRRPPRAQPDTYLPDEPTAVQDDDLPLPAPSIRRFVADDDLRPSSPVVSGYIEPYSAPPRRSAHRDYYEPADNGGGGGWGIAGFIWVPLAVLVGIGLLFGVVLVIALLASSSDGDSNNREPSPPATALPTSIPADQRPNVMISAPLNNTVYELGTVATIQFTAAHPQGITRVELRRFGQPIDTQPAAGQPTYQGSFQYLASSTGTHNLQVVAFSGDLEGNPSTVIIIVAQ